MSLALVLLRHPQKSKTIFDAAQELRKTELVEKRKHGFNEIAIERASEKQELQESVEKDSGEEQHSGEEQRSQTSLF